MENLFTAFAKGGNTPTEKELEDTPPLSFTGNGEPLSDWRIDGASGGVGDKTDNLYAFPYTLTLSLSGSGNNRTVTDTEYIRSNIIKLEPNTAYYFTGERAQAADSYGRIALFTDMPDVGSISTHFYNFKNNGSVTFTTDATENYALVFTAMPEDYDTDYKMMLIKDSTAPSEYIPYGYEISITCGGGTKTIYLDEPLGVSDSISMTDTGITIPTVDGSNTLSVGTTIQPSKVYIKYKGGDEMVTLVKIGGRYNTALLEIRGLSTDTKPTTKIEGMVVANGSTYIEIDTGDTYMFDAENGVWHNITG